MQTSIVCASERACVCVCVQCCILSNCHVTQTRRGRMHGMPDCLATKVEDRCVIYSTPIQNSTSKTCGHHQHARTPDRHARKPDRTGAGWQQINTRMPASHGGVSAALNVHPHPRRRQNESINEFARKRGKVAHECIDDECA